jgi:hypothetical protein
MHFWRKNAQIYRKTKKRTVFSALLWCAPGNFLLLFFGQVAIIKEQGGELWGFITI